MIAGFGLRSGCGADEIAALLREAERRAGVRVGVMAAPAFRGEERGLQDAAAALGLPLILLERAALAALQDRCVTMSDAALASVGLASVAEACALAAAGRSGRLVLARIASRRATCALAERPA